MSILGWRGPPPVLCSGMLWRHLLHLGHVQSGSMVRPLHGEQLLVDHGRMRGPGVEWGPKAHGLALWLQLCTILGRRTTETNLGQAKPDSCRSSGETCSHDAVVEGTVNSATLPTILLPTVLSPHPRPLPPNPASRHTESPDPNLHRIAQHALGCRQGSLISPAALGRPRSFATGRSNSPLTDPPVSRVLSGIG